MSVRDYVYLVLGIEMQVQCYNLARVSARDHADRVYRDANFLLQPESENNLPMGRLFREKRSGLV